VTTETAELLYKLQIGKTLQWLLRMARHYLKEWQIVIQPQSAAIQPFLTKHVGRHRHQFITYIITVTPPRFMKNKGMMSYPNLLWLAYSSAPVDQLNDSEIPWLPMLRSCSRSDGNSRIAVGDSTTAYTNPLIDPVAAKQTPE
jgi:hypothetical protein